MGEQLPGDVIVVEELQWMPGLLLPEDFHIKPEELLNDARRSYWFIAKYRTRTRVLSAPQPFMELGREYDTTKKKRVMANGLMRPGWSWLFTQLLMPLQLACGIRPGHHRQRVMRLTDALSQGWVVHPVAKEVLPWRDSRHEMLRAEWNFPTFRRLNYITDNEWPKRSSNLNTQEQRSQREHGSAHPNSHQTTRTGPVITIFFLGNGLWVNQSIAFINNESRCKPSGPTLNEWRMKSPWRST
uniref:Uncharacterized protein n=1 Tax=Caenorhabditis japonica TaxID=281687 RepID=A0A8R1IRG9_CAEJA